MAYEHFLCLIDLVLLSFIIYVFDLSSSYLSSSFIFYFLFFIFYFLFLFYYLFFLFLFIVTMVASIFIT